MAESPARTADKLDLIWISRTIWAHRIAIVAAAVICAGIGYAVGLFVIKSRAESTLQLSFTASEDKADKESRELRLRTTIADYKVLIAVVLAREGFLAYAAGKQMSPALIAELNSDLAKDNLLARWVRPVFAAARADLRDIPDQPRDEANYLVAVDIGVDRRSRDDALAIATVLGDYVRDSAILLRTREFGVGLYYKGVSRLLELDRNIVATRLALGQVELKQKEMMAIRNRYPDATRGDVRQVISIDKATSRFLPPVAQLVGAESQIAEVRETLRIAEWDVERNKALMAFLEPAQKIIRESTTGNELFQKLDALLAATFTEKRLADDPWRDAYSTLKIEILGLKTLYFERMRFLSAPTLNVIPLWLRMLPSFVGLLLGAALAALVVFAREGFARADTATVQRMAA